jgi:CHAD domain-containing protein
MTYRLEPQRPVEESVRTIAASQIDDLLADYGKGKASPTAIHEARKTVKRLRALLSLVREGIAGDDLRREKGRLREIAGTLAGARDAHVMIETATELQNGDMPRGCQSTAKALMALLEKKRSEADAALSAQLGRLPVDALQDVRGALAELPLDQLGFGEVLDGFVDTYRRGHKLLAEVAGGGVDDERYHDLRKEVQHHWRHLQLLSNAWPKALRPHIALAHMLAETLGKDHDLSILAAFVRENAGNLGPAKSQEAYLRLCAKAQDSHRDRAIVMARRLYADKPKAIRHRMRVYWETADALGKSLKGGNGKGEE